MRFRRIRWTREAIWMTESVSEYLSGAQLTWHSKTVWLETSFRESLRSCVILLSLQTAIVICSEQNKAIEYSFTEHLTHLLATACFWPFINAKITLPSPDNGISPAWLPRSINCRRLRPPETRTKTPLKHLFFKFLARKLFSFPYLHRHRSCPNETVTRGEWKKDVKKKSTRIRVVALNRRREVDQPFPD